MTTAIWTVRLFGGRDVGVTFDSSAGTIAILGQAITLFQHCLHRCSRGGTMRSTAAAASRPAREAPSLGTMCKRQ